MKLWLRNAIFLGLCLIGTGMVASRILERPKFIEPKALAQPSDFLPVVERVDQAFAAEWKSAGVSPVRPASELTLARRLSLALTGTIPSFEEIRALEQQPQNLRAQWWLAHLLEDQRYGDYFAERFARTMVGVEDGPFIVYRRRRFVNWLSEQFMANRPYYQIVRQMIAAEGIWTTKPEVNFVTVTVDQNNEKEGPDEKKLGGRVAKAFLGVRLDCVECHNDLINKEWKQKDFHQLAAFFAQSEMSMTGVRDNPDKHYEFEYHGEPKPEPVPAKVPFNEDLIPRDGLPRERLAAWVTHPQNRPFARALVNRTWALLFNRPLHAPVDSIPVAGPWHPAMEILADDLIAHHFDLQRLIRVIASTRAFQLDSRSSEPDHPVTPEQDKVFAAFPLTRLRPEQMAGSLLQSSKLRTIDSKSHVAVRVVRFFEENDFIKRYGDAGEDEFGMTGGTIPQRLVMMNGKVVQERTKEDLLMNAATRISVVAPNNDLAIETAYLTVLTRRPTLDERAYFATRFEADEKQKVKSAASMTDLFWTLLNSTEFSWNH